ncbi:MAG: hypothetical protein K0R34_4266 [Herbinix sp.]|jgi:hypothetical protein|nr:hypothetical protein [Herbinix sp.]
MYAQSKFFQNLILLFIFYRKDDTINVAQLDYNAIDLKSVG